MLKFRRFRPGLLRDQRGQSITEYGAIIAFVGVLIALAFNLANGGLFGAVSGSFSQVTSTLDATNKAVPP